MKPRLYLRVGDKVFHVRFFMWGVGEVTEERHSTLEGGCCLVRVYFEDGVERVFINDMNSELCCYYAGLRLR